MAAAVRLTSAAVVGSGYLAGRVRTLLPRSVPGLTLSPDNPSPDLIREVDLAILALEVPDSELASKYQRLVDENGVRLILVEYEYPRMRVGPVVGPSDKPCLDCYRARMMQFEEEQDQVTQVNTVPMLPHHSRLAAALVGREIVLGRVGTVTTVDLLTGAMRIDDVVPCADCGRCERFDNALSDRRQELAVAMKSPSLSLGGAE